jgi:hypothetical protein
MPLNRRTLVSAWVGALVGLSGLLLTFSTGWSLLFGSVVPPTIWLILSGAPRLTLAEAVAEELPPIHRTRTE